MNENCDVVRDLLPLYRDGVCSQSSRELVEAHLAECEACRSALTDIEREMLEPTPEMQQSFRAWQKLQRRMLHRRLRRIAVGALALVLAIVGGMFVRDVHEFSLRPMDVDDVEITALYRISDGRIYVAMQGVGHNLSSSIAGTAEVEMESAEMSGPYCIEPFWSRYDDRQLYYHRNEFDFVVPAQEKWSVDGVEYTFDTQTVEIVCGEERYVVCEFDDELPAAPMEIEVRAQLIADPIDG